VHDGEVGESLQGAPAAAGGALLDLDGPYRSLGDVVGKRCGEIGRETKDHVFVADESSELGAGFGREGARFAVGLAAAR
jgi:hypothetical protein